MARVFVVALVAVSLLGSACGDGGRRGEDARLSVVVSFYPLFEVAHAVGGERARVENLTPAGAEPHDLELEPDQVDDLEDADAVLYVGGGFQPAVEDVAERLEGAIDVLRGVELIEGDPHVWLDPVRFSAITGEVAEAFAKADPDGDDAYRANAADYIERLSELDGELRSGLQGCARRRFVTSHAAFGYLADRYGLTQEAIAGVSPESEPDPKRLAELADTVRADGTTTVFTETLVSPRVAETLAREAGVRTDVLNPIEGLTPEEQRAGENYFSVMRKNLAALRQALECA